MKTLKKQEMKLYILLTGILFTLSGLSQLYATDKDVILGSGQDRYPATCNQSIATHTSTLDGDPDYTRNDVKNTQEIIIKQEFNTK